MGAPRTVVFQVTDQHKTCTGCREHKDVAAFSRDSRTKTGIQARCKACYRLYDSARADYRRNLPGYHEKSHARHILRSFKLTKAAYNEMLLGQGHRCAICRTDKPGGEYISEWAVDHDHACCPGKTSCGKCVRALLCRSCNAGIGALGDDIERLRSAVDYLVKHSAKRGA